MEPRDAEPASTKEPDAPEVGSAQEPELTFVDESQASTQNAGPDIAAPTKVCANCSVQTQTLGDFCPNCGKAYSRTRRRPSRRAILITGIVAAVVILGGGGTAIALTVAHDNEVAAQAAAAEAKADKAAADAATAAAKKEADQKAADDAQRAVRKSAVTEVQASITTDAQARVAEGTLEGPIIETSCTPLGGGSTDDLTAITTTFTCIAINTENADGTASGYRFSATMNWDDGSYSWHLGD